MWLLMALLFGSVLGAGTSNNAPPSRSGRVVSVLPTGQGSILILRMGPNQGAQVGIAAHCRGVKEFTCKIAAVNPYRSRCVAEVELDAIGPACTCTVLDEGG